MMELTTIGYEGASLDDFIATLHEAEVAIVLDVRAVPVSRRRGFSKNLLKAALEEAGIGYVHLRGLGDPKEGRDAARAGNRAKFLSIFTAHMKTEEAVLDLNAATTVAGTSPACLLCYERDPKACHRTLVADSIKSRLSIRVKHLGVPKGFAANGRTHRARESLDACQGAAACG